MPFEFDTYKRKSARLVWDDLDLGQFATHPLDEATLRCLRYMHDVEYHTVCYLRDLLLTPAHRDPKVTGFLSLWVFEEFWHGESLAAVLDAHDELSGEHRVTAVRQRLGWRDRIRPPLMTAGGLLAKDDFTAIHMAWGAINEWMTQAGYSLLARRAANPVLSELLARIMRQEGRHIDFYATEARARLEHSPRARRLTRFALRHFWRPVGSGVMPASETCFVTRHLLGGRNGTEVVDRLDRNIDRLPGLDGLHLVQHAVTATFDTAA